MSEPPRKVRSHRPRVRELARAFKRGALLVEANGSVRWVRSCAQARRLAQAQPGRVWVSLKELHEGALRHDVEPGEVAASWYGVWLRFLRLFKHGTPPTHLAGGST